ncbi:shK domain-like domain-containing protein [Ditylenchus destructor]|uniref:ShK domain-like domain-containing protein n=1 Tax=Ditylenchus destructor TaxID=166010 RepID=A0AAD4MTC1_9BILA|nr:shK domain-like domain-containing protein [Ditylenchus destructor]
MTQVTIPTMIQDWGLVRGQHVEVHAEVSFLLFQFPATFRHHRPQVPNCRDIHLNCPLTSKLCMVDWAFDQMVEYCPKTCNRCPNREIIDISDSCRDERRKCNDPDNIDLMAWLCPRTCRYDRNSRPQRPSGRIGAAPAGCVDANSNCASWKANGFCENPFYYVEHKRLNCALSCGLCGATV